MPYTRGLKGLWFVWLALGSRRRFWEQAFTFGSMVLTNAVDQEVATMAHENVTDEELAELIQRTTEAAKAYIRGDMRTYFTLIRHGDDNTLMSPFGGEPTRGSEEPSPERLEALARFFQGGEAELEVVESYASGDLAVLVVIERQHGNVGGLPEQDWSLRVTWVFQRDESGWRQVHRHADPLVHGIRFEQLAVLARGSAGGTDQS